MSDKPVTVDSFAILEIDTGLIDGWYFDLDEANYLRDEYDKLRPGHQHLVVGLVTEHPVTGRRIPDSTWYANTAIFNRPTGGQS